MTTISDRDLLGIVEMLWEAATDFAKWEGVLRHTAKVFNATAGQLSHFNMEKMDLSFSVLHNLDSTRIHRYEELIKEGADPLTPISLRLLEKPFHCRMFCSDEEIRGSKFYKEMMFPDIEYRIAVLTKDYPIITSFGLCRGPHLPPFTTEHCDALTRLLPHIKGAAKLHVRFLELDFERQTSWQVLDDLPVGIVIAERSGRILHRNALAAEIAGDHDGLTFFGAQMTADDPATSARIRASIAEAIDHALAGTALPGKAVPVARPSGKPALSVLIAPLWNQALRYKLSVLDRPLAVLFVTDPERRAETPPEVLQKLFGLTPAEARVLDHVVSGLTLKDIAALTGRSDETVRSQLKSIFQKTATSRQADLVRLVLSSAAWLRVAPPASRQAEPDMAGLGSMEVIPGAPAGSPAVPRADPVRTGD